MSDFSYYEMKADKDGYFHMYYYPTSRSKFADTSHYHRSLEFVYVAAGSMPVHVDGSHWTMHTGDALFVESWKVHYYDAVEGAEIHIFLAAPEYLPHRADDEYTLPAAMTTTPEEGAALARLCGGFFPRWRSANPYSVYSFVNGFWGTLYENHRVKKAEEASPAFPITEILDYLGGHFTEDIHLQQLAKMYNYTETYFSACFNRYLNMHLREYVNRLRIRYADRLLEEGWTKTAAATACGYTSPNTFYRAFQKYHKNTELEIPGYPRFTES